jgi:hypothetical protein
MHHTQLQTLSLSQVVLLVIALFLVLAFYFLPTIIAIKRKSPHTTAVVILNFFLGVTLLGWIIALVLASKQPQAVVVVYNTPPPRSLERCSGCTIFLDSHPELRRLACAQPRFAQNRRGCWMSRERRSELPLRTIFIATLHKHH